ASETRRLLKAIGEQLAEPEKMSPNVARGAAGAALYFAYLYQTTGERESYERARQYLECALNSVVDDYSRYALLTGRTGVVWTACHLREHIATQNLDLMLDEFDAMLLANLEREFLRHGYGLTEGVVGYARYGLDHIDRPGGRRLVERAIARLLELAVP